VCIKFLLHSHFGNRLTNCSVNYRKLKGKLLFIIIRVITEHACDLTAVVLIKRKVVSTMQSYIDSVLNLEAVSHHFAPWDIVCDMRNKQCGRSFGRDAVVFI
jgi:hypothetical protein